MWSQHRLVSTDPEWAMGREQLTKSSTACPVNAGFLGDDVPAIAAGPRSGDVRLTCTVVASLISA